MILILMIYPRGWRSTLVGSNEDLKLKLPRAWEPLDRLWPSQDCEGISSQCVFSYGDTAR